MADTIQPRRDTAANWMSVNPILANGEMGRESDTGKQKYGNGIDVWNVLLYDSLGNAGSGDMLKSTYDTENNGVVDNAELVNSLTVETSVPAGAVFTDTIYDDTAIQSEVDTNTAKTGITTQQASDITTNNAKTSDISHPLVEKSVPSNAVFTDTVYDDTAIQAEIDLNTAKVTDVAHPVVNEIVPVGALFTDNDTTDHTAFSNIGINTHAQIDTALGNSVNNDSDSFAGTDLIQQIISLTQAEYDGLTPAANTLYVVVA